MARAKTTVKSIAVHLFDPDGQLIDVVFADPAVWEAMEHDERLQWCIDGYQATTKQTIAHYRYRRLFG